MGIPFLVTRLACCEFGDAIEFRGSRLPDASRAISDRGGELVVPGATNFLLSHNPDVFPVAAKKGFDLTISGHTHGGQINIEILHQM